MKKALANFGLSLLAVVAGLALFFGMGAATDFWNFALVFLGLGIASAGLFFWRRRPHFALAGLLGVTAGMFGLFGGGPVIADVHVSSWMGSVSLMALFWPVTGLFAGGQSS
ncbi:MAG: hypothetical protein V3T86_01600 [Planctomycetota bacterium]